MKLLIATRNQKKRREFELMLRDAFPASVEFVDVAGWPVPLPDVIEDRDTFVGNAVKKAVEMARAAGACAMSEDSGLVVDALDGAPGVYSARFAGPEASDVQNNAHLLQRLQEHPHAARTARYVATICLALLPASPLGELLLGRLPAAAPARDGLPAQQGIPSAVEEFMVVWWRGELEGRIIDTPRGEGGFGYDPHFEIAEWGETAAEVSPERKNSISHRGRALGELAAALGEA